MAGKSLPFWLWSLNHHLCILTNVPLLCSFIVHQNPELVYEYDLCRGNLFLLGSKEMTKDVKLGIIYTKFGRGYNKISDKKYQEFCVMQLV